MDYNLYGDVIEEKMYICLPIPYDEEKRFAPVAILIRLEDEDSNQLWKIRPLWESYKSVGDGGFGFDEDLDEIFSCNMDLHKDEYVFYNEIPGIVSKRIPPKRFDAWFFNRIGISYYDEIAILKATKGLATDRFVFIDYDCYEGPFRVPEVEKYGMANMMYRR